MRLNLKTYPNKILKTKCIPIKEVKITHKKWANAMHFFMKEFGGIGLAAPQVGNAIRLIVINTIRSCENGIKLTMINPEIIGSSEEVSTESEGCLSIPFTFVNIERHKSIKVKYTNLDGEEVEESFDGLNARVIQHEIDHLDGILMNDK